MSDKQGLTYEQKFEVLRLRAEGLGYRSIANELGVKRDQVRGFTRTKTAQRLAKKRGISLSDIATVNTNKTKKARKLNCKNCQRVYVKKESDINSTVYCSEVCKKELADKRKQEAIDKKTRPCVRCGELYVAGNGQQRYCSKECLYETLTCEACGDTFTTRYQHGKESQRTCSNKCKGGLLKRTHEEYYKDFSRIHKGSIVPLTLYDGTEEDITVWCAKCQKKTVGKAGKFIIKGRPKRCDYCAPINSLGEKAVERWLTSNGISFIAEYTFADLVHVSPLRYDFAILNDDDTIRCLIEYDGRHHFEPVETFGGVEYFHEVQRSDAIKSQYAEDNGIDLYRISYKQNKELKTLLENILK